VSARSAILGRLHDALAKGGGDEASRRAVVAARLGQPPKGVIPARGALDAPGRVALFASLAEKVAATVGRVASAAEVPAAVADYLRAHNLPAEVRTGADPRLAALPWGNTPIMIRRGPSDGSDAVSVSHAVAGIAETGTLVLTSGPDNPTTLNFLPETHIVVVAAADIVGDAEAAWEKIRALCGKATLPRTVNMVTGPSRSADIEQTLLLGAHGPRRLHIVVVG
jgi:L-lactate dehydrogenase complex protein LldG